MNEITKMLRLSFVFLGLALVLISARQAAADDSQLVCKDQDKLIETIQKVYDPPLELVNIVEATPRLSLKLKDGTAIDKTVLVKSKSDSKSLPIKLDEDGNVVNLKELSSLALPVESCRDAELKEDNIQLAFSIDLKFKNTSGTYSYAELAEGLEDGSKILKSLAPFAVRLLVPKYESIVIGLKSDTPAQQIIFKKSGRVVDVPVHSLPNIAKYVFIKDMKQAGADTLEISPPSNIVPFFGEKTIKKNLKESSNEQSD